MFQLRFFLFLFVLFKLAMKATSSEGEEVKVLVLADALGTHYDFALNIVNILSDNGYLVHFPVVRYDPNRELTPPRDSSRVKFIQIPFKKDAQYEQHFGGGQSPMITFMKAQTKWDEGRMAAKDMTQKFAELVKYNMFTYYKAVLEHEFLDDEGKTQNMLDWLVKQHYDLGIAEFCVSSGPLAVFHRIGLKDYIVTSAAPPLPITLYMLGQKLVADVPERFSAMPGDGNNETKIRNNNSVRRKRNIAEYRQHIKFFTKVYNVDYKEMYNLASKRPINEELSNDEMPPMGELLRRARFFLVNNHPLARFHVNVSKRIKFIGGLDVEYATTSRGIQMAKGGKEGGGVKNAIIPLPKEYEWIRNEECVVVFSMGTMIGFNGFIDEYVKALHSAISGHPQCKFLLRVDKPTAEHLRQLDKKNGKNMKIVVMPERIPQKEILTQYNVRAFIYHCGQNTFNEVLYAGVPFICIPFFGDQFYNAAVAEYMGIGIWVEHDKFVEQFAHSLDQLLKATNSVEKAPHHGNIKSSTKYAQLSGQIADFINSNPQRPKFLKIIEKTMHEKKAHNRMEYVFQPMKNTNSQIEVNENPIIEPNFGNILKQFMKSAKQMKTMEEKW